MDPMTKLPPSSVPPEPTKRARVLTRPPSSEGPLGQPLTKRETDVLRLVTEGLSNKGIADRLNISAHTVKFHLENAGKKIGARSRTKAAVHFALQQGTALAPATARSGSGGHPQTSSVPMTIMPPSKVAKYDPELSASLVTKAKALVATPDRAFSFPDMRAVDLAIRLVAPGPKACGVSASDCHEITKAVIAAYGRDAFPIKACEAITALADQLEAAGVKAKESNKWYDEAHELRSRLKRSDAALAAAGAPMDELLTDQGVEWIRGTLDAIALQLDAVQVDRTLPLVVQVEALRNERDGLRKDQLFVTALRGELETVTSLCAKAQRDRDFFRSEAEERGRELRALQLIPRVHEES